MMDDRSVPPNIAALSQAGPVSTSAWQVLVKFVRDLTLFHTPDREAYATGVMEGHREAWLISGKTFRMSLTRQFLQDQGKAPPTQVLNDMVQALEAQAFGKSEQPVFYRVASLGDATYLDLAAAGRRVVKITADEWRLIEAPAVSFVRSGENHALSPPAAGGTLDPLRGLLNLASEEDWQLLVGWLIGACRAVGPYPILVLQGEQGTAKSTVAKMLKYLLDPSPALLRSCPRNEQDLFIAARHAHVLAFDNLSGLLPWQSDAFCRLATGGAFATRRLFSDGDEVILQAQRPVILNGIDNLMTRHDLIDRSIVLTFLPIPDSARRTDKEMWEHLTAIRPAVLGGLMTAVQSAMANRDRVVLSRLPRMADFAAWVTAAESGLGWEPETFLRAYGRNRDEAIELGLEASPIASHLRTLMDSLSFWNGTATELLEKIRSTMTETEQRARSMPQSPQELSKHLTRLASALRSIGIEVIGHRQGGTGQRLITITKRTESVVTVVTPVTSVPSADHSKPTESGVTAMCDKGDTCDTRPQGQPDQGYPLQIEGLGRLRREAVGRCTDCEELTSFAYNGVRVCGTHARLRAQVRPDQQK